MFMADDDRAGLARKICGNIRYSVTDGPGRGKFLQTAYIAKNLGKR